MLISFGGSKEHPFPSFPASRGCLHSLGSWPLLHLQGQPRSIFSWVCPPHGFSLWTCCLPRVSNRVINLGPPEQSNVSSLNTSLSQWFLKRNWASFLSLLLRRWFFFPLWLLSRFFVFDFMWLAMLCLGVVFWNLSFVFCKLSGFVV